VIHHRKGCEVIFGQETRHLFLIVLGISIDEVGGHDVLYPSVRRCQEEVLETDCADELSLFINHIGVVYGLLVETDPSDFCNRLICGDILTKLDELGGHESSGGVFRIPHEAVDHASICRWQKPYEMTHNLVGKLVKEFGQVIGVHLLENRFDPLLTEVYEKFLLCVVVKE
jgi:hypothetical protein